MVRSCRLFREALHVTKSFTISSPKSAARIVARPYSKSQLRHGIRRTACTPFSTVASRRTTSSEAGSNNPSKHTASTGLFSIPNLRQPIDFISLAKKATLNADSHRNALQAIPHSSSQPVTTVRLARQTLHLLDAISNEVCSIIDAAECCRCVHPDESWREYATQAFSMLSTYIGTLNGDVGLYDKLRSVCDAHVDVLSELTEEETRMMTVLRTEFERDGIHLSLEQRTRVQETVGVITNLESLFANNITHQKHYRDLNREDVCQIIPHHVLSSMVPQSNQSHDRVTISSDDNIVNTLLKYSPNPSLRRDAFLHANTSCPENLEVLERLRNQRHSLATQLGFDSYATKFLSDKMAGDRRTVHEFLTNMSHKVKRGVKTEMELLQNAKFQMEQSSEILPWDIPYYTGLIKSQSIEGGFDTSMISPYLTVSNCLDGLTNLVQRLFGIQMVSTPFESHEGPEQWHESVQKISLIENDTGENLGIIYLDLYPREDKYVHAAHFTIRCGCAVHDAESWEEQDKSTFANTKKPTDNVEYQRPIVALVCNLSSSNGSATSATANNATLSHSEVETLFHEFGHALHSLLSRTSFQHLSGTRASTDFVETPSNLMEHFAWDPRVLETMCVNSLGESIPPELLQKLIASRYAFQCLDIQNQILYASFDQQLFGPQQPVPTTNGGGTNTVPTQTPSTTLFAELHHQHSIPYAEHTHWHSRFGHLISYGAGYYGYLYDQVFAADIWRMNFASDPFSREEGTRLRHEILVHGGSKDPHTMLKGVLRRDPNIDSFFATIQKK
mmetsp:Transcript_18935/g.23307  ORF Transcript_18935/g.23307 Transcript_18935/m.23307 type:complete len:788 (-) Transcript_18935:129-2492(-)